MEAFILWERSSGGKPIVVHCRSGKCCILNQRLQRNAPLYLCRLTSNRLGVAAICSYSLNFSKPGPWYRCKNLLYAQHSFCGICMECYNVTAKTFIGAFIIRMEFANNIWMMRKWEIYPQTKRRFRLWFWMKTSATGELKNIEVYWIATTSSFSSDVIPRRLIL